VPGCYWLAPARANGDSAPYRYIHHFSHSDPNPSHPNTQFYPYYQPDSHPYTHSHGQTDSFTDPFSGTG